MNRWIWRKRTISLLTRETTNRASLLTVPTTFEEYKKALITAINSLTWHSFLAKGQANFFKSKKESLLPNKPIFQVILQRIKNFLYRIRFKVSIEVSNIVLFIPWSFINLMLMMKNSSMNLFVLLQMAIPIPWPHPYVNF